MLIDSYKSKDFIASHPLPDSYFGQFVAAAMMSSKTFCSIVDLSQNSQQGFHNKRKICDVKLQ